MKLLTSAAWPRDRAILVCTWIAFVIWCLNGLFVSVRDAMIHPEGTDLGAYVTAARVKRDHGQGIHDWTRLQAAGRQMGVEASRYIYPPPLAEAMVGTSDIPFPKIHLLWITASYLVVIAFFGLVIQLAQARGASALTSTLFTFGVFVSYSPIQREIFYSQVSLICAMLTTAVLLLDARERGRWVAECVAGAAAGLATIVKIYPAVLFFGFALQRRWRPIAAGILVMVLIAAVSVACYGTADWFSFLDQHASKEASAASIYADPTRKYLQAANYSLTQVLFLWTRAVGLAVPPDLLAKLARASLVAGGAAFLWYFRRPLRETNSLALWCHAVMLFFLPISVMFWHHVFLFYLPGIVLTGVALLNAREVPAVLWMVWMAGAAVIGLADYAPNIDFFSSRPPLFILKPLKFYGLVIHGCAFGWMLRSGLLSAPPRSAESP